MQYGVTGSVGTFMTLGSKISNYIPSISQTNESRSKSIDAAVDFTLFSTT